MKNLLLAGLFLLALLAGCSKRKYKTSVFGYVVEKNGSRKLAGVKVYLVEDQHGTYNVTQTYHDSTISGPDGHYSFKFNLGEGEFRVIAEAENYYPVTTPLHNRDSYLLKLGQSQSYNIELWAYAWLKLRFINQSGADGVTVNRLVGEHTGYQIFGVNDATVTGLVRGNEAAEIDYFVFPGNVHHEEHVYCPGLDTTYHEIIY
jgi:hypothetical protein